MQEAGLIHPFLHSLAPALPFPSLAPAALSLSTPGLSPEICWDALCRQPRVHSFCLSKGAKNLHRSKDKDRQGPWFCPETWHLDPYIYHSPPFISLLQTARDTNWTKPLPSWEWEGLHLTTMTAAYSWSN